VSLSLTQRLPGHHPSGIEPFLNLPEKSLIDCAFIPIKMPFYAVPIPTPSSRTKTLIWVVFSGTIARKNVTLVERLTVPHSRCLYGVRQVGTLGTIGTASLSFLAVRCRRGNGMYPRDEHFPLSFLRKFGREPSILLNSGIDEV
jgi:hypothetical protein